MLIVRQKRSRSCLWAERIKRRERKRSKKERGGSQNPITQPLSYTNGHGVRKKGVQKRAQQRPGKKIDRMIQEKLSRNKRLKKITSEHV